MATRKTEANGALPRVRRFLQKPWHEKSRTFLAQWTRIFPNISVLVRLPFGAWWVARNDYLGSTLPSDGFEPAERSFVEHFLRPGMTVLDIGAHHGFYTLLASKCVGPNGKVIAFEPSPRERKALRLNVKLNRCKNVSILELALGDEETEGDLFVVEGRQTGWNSLRPPDIPSPTSSIRVRIGRLDNSLRSAKIDRVDFIKLDVEGGELGVLRGATDLLERRPRPLILAELQDVRAKAWGHRAKDVAAFLQGFGFRWFKPTLGGSLANVPEDPDEYDDNLVAVPAERMGDITEIGGFVRKFKAPIGSDSADMPSEGKGSAWENPYETLRKRWGAVPTATAEFESSTKLMGLSDKALLAEWEKARTDITTGPEFAHRGWYHALYADSMRGKKVMDVGSGFAVDSITFAQHGANLTLVDLVETNLQVVKRLCKMMGLEDVQFQFLEDLGSLRALDMDYDVIMAMGSLHHAPAEVTKPEYQELLRHLKVGGRWLQLAYPKARWIRDGRPRFKHWGLMTDGPGTPWAEPYDLEKLLSMFEPAKFDVVLYQEFHNSDFNWFDLLYRGT